MNNNLMNIVAIAFIALISIYSYSKYDERNKEKKRLQRLDSKNLCYIFSNIYINIFSINGNVPLPISKGDYDNFKEIPEKSKGFVFDYTSILELHFEYSEIHSLKKNLKTHEMKSIFNVKPGHIYYFYADYNDLEEITFKFEDITDKSKK